MDFDTQKELDDLNAWEDLQTDDGLPELMDLVEAVSVADGKALEAAGFRLHYLPKTRLAFWENPEETTIKKAGDGVFLVEHACGCHERSTTIQGVLEFIARDQHDFDCSNAPEPAEDRPDLGAAMDYAVDQWKEEK